MDERDQASDLAAAHLAKLPIFQKSEHIACYLPYQDEFNANPLINTIWQTRKTCYLPILITEKDRELGFVPYKYGDELHINRHSILEPKVISNLIEPSKLDLVVVPLIAFDRKGNRLGTGGGYYDHTFAFLKTQYHKQPQLFGLAYASQEVDILPHDPWDVPLQGIITERGIILCS